MSHRVGIQIFWRYGIPNYKYTLHAHNYMYERERGSSNTYTHCLAHRHIHIRMPMLYGALYVVWMCLFLCVLLEHELQPSSLPLLLPTSKSARTINNISAGEAEEEDNSERRRGNINNNSWLQRAEHQWQQQKHACDAACYHPTQAHTHRYTDVCDALNFGRRSRSTGELPFV